ncbi:MAG: ABC transporter permease [Lachnospiraceae bacterium]|nr:ABC transporter permease [Lachnospiraceae bacterium]
MKETLKNCIKNKTVLVSVTVILLILLVSLLAPVLFPGGDTAQDLLSRLSPPGGEHLLGTDELGRDEFARMLYGTRVSLMIALIPTILAVIIGTVLGIAGAAFGKAADLSVTWLADVTMAMPGVLLAMVVLYTFGGTTGSVVLSIVIMEWGGIARIVRSVTMSLMNSEYVLAARTMGVGKRDIMLRHILPNLLPTLIVLFTLNIPTSVLSESALSFLGIGVQPPGVSLGLMVNQSKQFLFQMPWLALAPAGMILILVMAFSFLGDALRNILDPTTKY